MKDIFTSYFAQAILLLANFVGGVLAARLLLPVGRGELGQAMLWPTLIAALGGFSIGDAIIYFTAGRRVEAPRVIASALAIGAILSLILVLGGLAALPRLYAGTSPEVRSTADFFLLFIPLGYAAAISYVSSRPIAASRCGISCASSCRAPMPASPWCFGSPTRPR